ncbi:hypothetical protein P9173_09090 [Bacillus safensis]|uniref:hypothetical protein n=1 Tax=Bacillus TaxID=1386 RepID=UPI00228164ED|nr:hypothetical protein [Bacillus safensis]MCY7542543.1 hypothetical protein [Bacillus safensis]MCY7551007.1 hypothetical protein [Bacillus safensis]MCY7644849.1 hypothetical protein [Bacillus safensis]MCY7655836.1 hypothetical protein [Bacillus safensis]MEC3710310.1 hypothetical protein [Bacillus safensis]
MSDTIFNKITVLKKDLYSKLKQIMLESGWQNISSRPSTDYDVMFSNGEDGKKEIYFQMRDIASTIAGSSSIFSNSSSRFFSIRLSGKYLPGSSGVSGTFSKNSDTWKAVVITYQSEVFPNQPIEIYYSCNKDRLIFLTDYSLSLALPSTLNYIGVPVTFADEHEWSSCVFASSSIGSGRRLYVTDIKNDYTATVPITCLTYLGLGSKNKIGENIIMSNVIYGSTSEGLKGAIPEVFSFGSTDGLIHGDLVRDGDKVYKVFETTPGASTVYSSFISKFIAIRIQ